MTLFMSFWANLGIFFKFIGKFRNLRFFVIMSVYLANLIIFLAAHFSFNDLTKFEKKNFFHAIQSWWAHFFACIQKITVKVKNEIWIFNYFLILSWYTRRAWNLLYKVVRDNSVGAIPWGNSVIFTDLPLYRDKCLRKKLSSKKFYIEGLFKERYAKINLNFVLWYLLTVFSS